MTTHQTRLSSTDYADRSPLPATDQTEVVLEMLGITKDFPGGRVLHGVDLKLHRGEVHALVGQNGAGKSTLMKILAGHYPDHGGTITVDGRLVHMRSPKSALDQCIAIIYQEFALAPDLTVAENIALGREPRHSLTGFVDRAELLRRSGAEAKSLGIDLPLDVPVGKLSVAQQQLTEIVKAVARDAQVLVMDEPTARLSSSERDQLFVIIRKMSKKGVGIVYISHFLEEVFAIATNATVLRDGHCVAKGPLSELNVGKLARLIVGDMFRELDISKRKKLGNAALARPPLLEVKDLFVEAMVKPSSFTLHRGEVIGLAGLQGSGRTDLADALVGNGEPRRGGKVSINGFTGLFNSPHDALAKGVLMLPASRKTQGILPTRPLSENIAIGALRLELTKWGIVRKTAWSRVVDSMLDRFSVRPRDPSYPIASLSGGNQQKILFARAVAAKASVLILDQPTAGVDVGATAEIYDQIDALTEAGMGVIVISDDLNELLRLSDRIFLVKEGAIIDDRPAAEYNRASLLAAITSGMKPEDYHASDDSLGGMATQGNAP